MQNTKSDIKIILNGRYFKLPVLTLQSICAQLGLDYERDFQDFYYFIKFFVNSKVPPFWHKEIDPEFILQYHNEMINFTTEIHPNLLHFRKKVMELHHKLRILKNNSKGLLNSHQLAIMQFMKCQLQLKFIQQEIEAPCFKNHLSPQQEKSRQKALNWYKQTFFDPQLISRQFLETLNTKLVTNPPEVIGSNAQYNRIQLREIVELACMYQVDLFKEPHLFWILKMIPIIRLQLPPYWISVQNIWYDQEFSI